jgi:hypothetical protein
MSTAPAEKSLPPQKSNTSLATTGLTFSMIGVVGWFVMLGLILSVYKENYTGDGQRDVVVGIQNFGAYLLQVLIGLVGLSVIAVLSLSGTVISITAHNQGASNKSTAGIVLGIVGIVLGVGLIVYRMSAWGLFSS